MMEKAQVTVNHEVGLHARPATQFIKLASQFPSNIKIRNLTTDSKEVNAKSMMHIMTLAVKSGHTVEISADGEQSAEAVKALVDLINSNFGE